MILSDTRDYFIKPIISRVVLAFFSISDFFPNYRGESGQCGFISQKSILFHFICTAERAEGSGVLERAWRFFLVRLGEKSSAWRRKSKNVLRKRPIIFIETVWAPIFFFSLF